MNLNFNDMYTKRSGEDILIFLKSYIQQNKVGMHHLDNTKYRFDKMGAARDRFIEHMQEAKSIIDGGDMGSILSEYDMLQTGRFNDKDSRAKINIALGQEDEIDEDFEAASREALQIMEQNKRKNDPRFIQKLDQEIIEKLKLTLIDIKSLEKMNKLLLVFIDENNKKKFFVDDFSYEFVISNINSIIYNDYVVQFDPRFHTWIICTDMKEVDRLRMQINKARDDFYKTFAWED